LDDEGVDAMAVRVQAAVTKMKAEPVLLETTIPIAQPGHRSDSFERLA
jgi:hypothetical protein